eukprot:6193338-Pleurochrysis_carterae.AAC.2
MTSFALNGQFALHLLDELFEQPRISDGIDGWDDDVLEGRLGRERGLGNGVHPADPAVGTDVDRVVVHKANLRRAKRRRETKAG